MVNCLVTVLQHWHGITQKHSTEMDGAALVSQCPIVPGHSFLYATSLSLLIKFSNLFISLQIGITLLSQIRQELTGKIFFLPT